MRAPGRALCFGIALGAACSREPSSALVEAMRGYCSIGDLEPARRTAALQQWLGEIRGDREVLQLYLAANRGDRPALRALRDAAGDRPCRMLDSMEGSTR